MKIIKLFGLVTIVATLVYFATKETPPGEILVAPNLPSVGYKKIPKLIFAHVYEEKYEPVFANLVLPGKETPYGVDGNIAKFTRSLRWKCITDAAEDRWGLPRGCIFAIMVQESCGIEFLGNSRNDGGFGLCHMQPSTATYYGMKIFKACKETVCYEHAVVLKSFIAEHRNDRGLLAQTDWRLDHIKNIDAAARIIASYMAQVPSHQNALTYAFSRYGPQENEANKDYVYNVTQYMRILADGKTEQQVIKNFNATNKHLLIDGKPGTWTSYIGAYRKLADNYGLSQYMALPKYVAR